jgi:hypothetical protein
VQDIIFPVPHFAKALLRIITYQYVFLEKTSDGLNSGTETFRYGMPVYTGPFRTLPTSKTKLDNHTIGLHL